MSVNVNKISSIYEKIYKSFEKHSSKDECFYAINNAMILAYFSKYCNSDENINYEDLYKMVVDKFGFGLFFHGIKKTEQYKENFYNAMNVFMPLFKSFKHENVPLEEVLGNVLEKHVNRKETGSYYTPSDATDYITYNSILISLIKKCPKEIQDKIQAEMNITDINAIVRLGKKANSVLKYLSLLFSSEEKKEFCDSLYSLKIIDPTCGSGAFIVSAFKCLTDYLNILDEKEIDYKKALNCIYGVDISKEAIQFTKIRLLMKCLNNSIDISVLDEIFNSNFMVADALIGSDYVINENGFDWTQFGTTFDCIIGNPPYIEKSGYVSRNFVTYKCGNLYANTIERSCNISSKNGVISFVVPLSFVSTKRMQNAKNYLENNSDTVYYMTFADRPGCIFSGVHQRLVIFIAIQGNNNNCEVYSTKYNYWYKEERNKLFEDIFFYKNNYSGLLPKIGNKTEESIYTKLTNGLDGVNLLMCEESIYPIYMSTRIGFWMKAYDKNVFSSKEYKTYYANSENNYYFLLALFNSSTFYFLWVISSDCWHITKGNIELIKYDLNKLESLNYPKIKKLVNELMIDLENNKKYIGSKQTKYEYKHKFSKHIIDEIDKEIKGIFNLTEEEYLYITQYTEKYRINTLEDR